MSLKAKLAITVALQMVGVLATTLSSVVIAWRYGPAAQGYLSYIRSTVDFLSGVGIFGFPQAFVYLINSNSIKTGWAIRFATLYGAVFGLLALVLAGGIVFFDSQRRFGLGSQAIAIIAVAASGLVWHGMYRAISLSVKSTYTFNIISILPFIFVVVGFWIWQPAYYQQLTIVIALSAIVSAGIAYAALVKGFETDRDEAHVDHRSFITRAVRYSFWSFIPTVSAALVTTLTYTVLRQGGAAEAAAGYFSTSLLFLSASVLPLNMIIPVLYDTWSKSSSQTANVGAYIQLAHIGPVIAIAVAAIAFGLTGHVTKLVFGAAYQPSVRVTQLLLLGTYILYENRLLSAMLLALGSPRIVAAGTLLRAVVIICGLYVDMGNPLIRAALVWNAGELACLAYLAIAVARKTERPLHQMLGLSPTSAIKTLRSLAHYRPRVVSKPQS